MAKLGHRLTDQQRSSRFRDDLLQSLAILERVADIERWKGCTIDSWRSSALDLEHHQRCAAVDFRIMRHVDETKPPLGCLPG